MARSASLFNGTTAGKVGEVVFFRAKGQQRARQYVGQINDRKSQSQVTQRVMLAPCIIAYRLFKALLADSFVNSPISQSGYNAFVSANKVPNVAYYTKELVAAATFSWAPYIMSKGSLTPLPLPEYVENTLEYTMPNGTGTGMPAFQTEFKAAFPDALDTDKFVYSRIMGDNQGAVIGTRTLSWLLSDGAFPAGVAYTAGKLIVTLPAGASGVPFCAVTIRSQRDANGKLNVSTQSLRANTPAGDFNADLSGDIALQSATASYGYNAQGVL